MQGIILAAGTGSRLKHMTESLPKALITVVEKPLLAYTLAFARAVGCEEIIVVVGAFQEKVVEFLSTVRLPKVRWVENPDYLIGNLYSLGAARAEIREDFLLLNTDHIYNRKIPEMVRKQCDDLVAFCDHDRQLGSDDMKVLMDGDGRLKSISKQLSDFDRGYVGMTFCPTRLLEAYFQAFDRVADRHKDRAVVEMVLGDLAQNGVSPVVGDISGAGWLEIDTPEEHAKAQETIRNSPADFLVVE